MEQRETRTGGDSVDLKTLAIAAVAAVVAAVVTSTFWSKGALVSTALTPVIVSLVKEGLNRHAAKVAQPAARVVTAPVKGVAALAGVGAREREEGSARPADGPGSLGTPWPGRPENGSGAPADGSPTATNGHHAPTGGVPATATGDAPAYSPPASLTFYGRRRFRWKVALLTGLAAFVVAAAALTLPELVFGGSVTGNGGGTTLFGGGERAGQEAEGGSSEGASGSESGTDDGGVEQSSDPEAQSAAPEEEAPVEQTEEPAPEEPAPEEEEPAPVEPESSEPVEPQAAPAPSE